MGWEAKIHPPHCHPPPSQESGGPFWIDKSLLSSWGLRTSVLEWVHVGCTTVPTIIAAAVVFNTTELIYRTACSVVFNSLRPHELQTAKLLCPQDSPGKNTGVGYHFLLQGIFQTQVSNRDLLHWQADSLLLSHFRSHTFLTHICSF